MENTKDRTIKRAASLLDLHKDAIIEELGSEALELLTPRQAAKEILGREEKTPNISDLVRQGWLAPAPDKDVGHAHQYYRWRVEFVKRYRKTHKK